MTGVLRSSWGHDPSTLTTRADADGPRPGAQETTGQNHGPDPDGPEQNGPEQNGSGHRGLDHGDEHSADAPSQPVDLDLVLSAVAEGGSAALAVTVNELGDAVVRWANTQALNLLALTADEVSAIVVRDGAEVNAAAASLMDSPIRRNLTTEVEVAALEDWKVVVREAIDGHWNAYPPEWRSAAIETTDRSHDTVEVMVARASGAAPSPDAGSSPAPGSYAVWMRPFIEHDHDAEQARRESEHRFRLLAEHAPVGIIFSDAGVRLGFVNNRFAEIAGCQPAKLMGTGWMAAIYPEDLPELIEKLGDVLGGKDAECTVRLVAFTGAQRWVHFRLSAVTTPRKSAGFIGTVEDITERRAWETQLSYQASHDALTGLANRRNLVESLTELLVSRRSRDRDIAVLFCDLDGFKNINDSLGHDAGDRVLIEVAQRLSVTARDHDLVARIAGDEFVVMMREVTRFTDAEAAARRQLAALEPVMNIAGQQIRITASIGIAMGRDHDCATALLRAADHGMYDAKRAGGGIYRSVAGRPPGTEGEW